MNNNNIIAPAPPSGSAVLSASHYTGNSLLHLLPLQINGPGTAGSMNIGGVGNSGSKLVGPPSSNVLTSGNNNSTFTLLPQMAFIATGVGPPPVPTNFGDLSALQQSPSSVSPMISVITSSNNTINSQPNASFLMPSGVQNNSVLSGTATAVPISVILSGSAGTTATNNMTVDAGGPHGTYTGPVGEMQTNSAIPASILIRNRPQYQSQGITKTTASTVTRHSIDHQPPAVTVLNEELLKQIVVGCTSKNNTLTHAPSSNSNTAVNSSQTLLKTPSHMNTIPGLKQQNSSSKSTTLLTQASKVPTVTATTSSSIQTHSLKKPFQQLNALHNTSKATSILQIPTNTKLPLSEAAKDTAVSSSGAALSSNRRQSGGFIADLLKEPRPNIPPPANTSAMEAPNQANVSVIKSTSIINPSTSASKVIAESGIFKQSKTACTLGNSTSGSSGTFKVEIDLTKPVLVQAKLVERQESLLKARPVQRVIESSTSPRSKRSKSLSCAFREVQQSIASMLITPKQTSLISAQQSLSERRHSTASENKISKQNDSPSRDNQTLASNDDTENEYEIIDLIDYNEEEHELMEVDHQNINAEQETQNLKVHAGAKAMENKRKLKCPPTQVEAGVKPPDDVKAKSTTIEVTNMKTLKTTMSTASTTTVENESEMPINKQTSDVTAHIDKPSIKIEIIMDEGENLSDQQATENEDMLSQDAKGEEAQTSVEHAQDSLEKSLYCDEKISISSTSSASTSSSRQSLHDDVPLSSSLIPAKSTPLRSHQASTSAAAGITTTTQPIPLVPTTAAEESLSCALKMLSNFNMLTWNQRIGSARASNMRFQLNEFNLIEINERCSPRTRIHTAYEKPIYERESVPYLSEKNDFPLYLCRRCNCHGPALDFLAPEFCSLDCLKRESRKRRHEEFSIITRKRKAQETSAPPPGKKSFRWSTYLPEKFNAIAAPVNLFINPFPTGPNRFQIGMKLEAIDPENCSLFCVCTIVDIQGYRLKLTFDGYEYMYDFWVNADSMDIFPPGWCVRTKRVLQPPKGKTVEEFSWTGYLQECKAIAAQRVLFTHLNASFGTHNPFKIGMHLEAEDLNDTGKLCVASVADVLDNRIRVHFDGWDDCYDYWVDISSPYIHACGWHVGRQQLIVPPEFENNTFSWPVYIKNHGSGMGATEEMFSTRDPIDFKSNMKLEVVDPRNPSLIRPATVVGRKGHRVKLHLDCWSSNYCFWLEDDSADLHPIGWCDATDHNLEPPPGYKMRSSKMVCTTFGCRGIGNAKRLYLNTHSTQDYCPYAPENWRQKVEKPPRLEHDEIVRPVSRNKREIQSQQQPQPPKLQWKQPQPPKQQQLNEAQILQHIQLLDNIKTRHVIQQEKQQQKHTAQQHRAHRNSIASAKSQQQSLIKTEPADKPATSVLRVLEPIDSSNVVEVSSTSLLLPQIKIAKEFLYDYGPRLQQNYNIWQRNVAFDMQRIKRNPLLWTTKDTCAFVQCVLRDSETTEAFLREDIDGSALLLLQQSELTEMLELKLGPAVKLYSCILQLRTLAVLKFDVKQGNASGSK